MNATQDEWQPAGVHRYRHTTGALVCWDFESNTWLYWSHDGYLHGQTDRIERAKERALEGGVTPVITLESQEDDIATQLAGALELVRRLRADIQNTLPHLRNRETYTARAILIAALKDTE